MSLVVGGILAFFVIFPVVLLLASGRDITRMIGRPEILANSPRVQLLTQLIGFVPLLITCVATGIIVLGNGPHFNTPHKVCRALPTVLVSAFQNIY